MKRFCLPILMLLCVNMMAQKSAEHQKVDLFIQNINAISSNDKIEDLYVKDNMVWIGGKDGVYSYNTSSSTLSRILRENSAVAIKVSRKGDVYSAFKNNKIYLNDKIFARLTQEGLQINDLEIYKGKLWVATNQGVMLYSLSSGNELRSYHVGNSKLKSNQVNFIRYFRPLDNLWIGTSAGVNEIRDGDKWTKTDFPKENFIAVTESIDGLWLLSDSELHLVFEDYGKNYRQKSQR